MNKRTTVLFLTTTLLAACAQSNTEGLPTRPGQEAYPKNLSRPNGEETYLKPVPSEIVEILSFDPITSEYKIKSVVNGIDIIGTIFCPTAKLCEEFSDIKSGELSRKISPTGEYPLPDGSSIYLTDQTFQIVDTITGKRALLTLVSNSIDNPGGSFILIYVSDLSQGDLVGDDFTTLQSQFFARYAQPEQPLSI